MCAGVDAEDGGDVGVEWLGGAGGRGQEWGGNRAGGKRERGAWEVRSAVIVV